ncbi:hypothetical protein J2Z21_008800 [Streptomyces griseochromogenes]|uniref:Uncharacterized protein n=1 Tax=Streptomyces griseochromogenes TaxID=68214 RepID=A0ABS4M7X7_9ACTN|nr:hypothetical protein [Streptomyces griseochromogenes]
MGRLQGIGRRRRGGLLAGGGGPPALQIGGDPNDARNLRVEPADPGHKPGSGVNNLKDPVETKPHTAVCSGNVTLKAAQRAIATDWTPALSQLGLA